MVPINQELMKILISQWQKADSFFTKWFGNDGYLFSAQVAEEDISKTYLAKFVKEKNS